MKDKILTVISIIMEANINNLDENTSSKNVENWDSLRHMNLIVAVEEEFEIELTDDEIVGMNSYKEIERVLKSYNIN